MPMLGAEEAQRYLGAYAGPQQTQGLKDTINRNADRRLAILQRKGESEEAHAGDGWRAIEGAYKSGMDQYDKAKTRGREDRRLGTEEELAKRDMKSADIRNERDDMELATARGKRDYLAGTEEGQMTPRQQQLYASGFKEDLERPANEKALRELNMQSTRSGIALTGQNMRQMELDNQIVQEDRNLNAAAEEYAGATRRNDTRELANLDAKWGDKLGPGGIMRAKDKAAQSIQSGTMLTNMNVRGTQEGQMAMQKIGEVDKEVQGLQNLARDVADFTKARKGSEQEGLAKTKLQTTLNAMGRQGEAEMVGGGLAGMKIDTNGITRASDRAVQTLGKIKGEAQQKIAQIKGQYGSLPGTEVQGAINRLEQTVAEIEILESQAKLNAVNLLQGGGGGGMGSQNGQFLRTGVGAPSQNLMQPPAGGIQQGGVPNQIALPGFQQQAPSMRQSAVPPRQ